MTKNLNINTPVLIGRIKNLARLSDSQSGEVQRFSKMQLLELYAYVSECGRTIDELTSKIQSLQKG